MPHLSIFGKTGMMSSLLINDRQKNDGEYSVILDSVRHGHLNEDAITVLSLMAPSLNFFLLNCRS